MLMTTLYNPQESLEVASQCLQTAFCLSSEDTHLEVNTNLEDMFETATKGEPVSKLKAAKT